MNNNITIALTTEEINALQISICVNKIQLEDKIRELEKGNKTGINTKLIKKKRERIQELDALFSKLYKAEQHIK